jgi:hypothetical protein
MPRKESSCPHGRQCIIATMTHQNETSWLNDWFSFHPPANPEVAAAHDMIRNLFLGLATQLDRMLPTGGPASNMSQYVRAQEDRLAAFWKLREAMYAANAALACNADENYTRGE